MTELVVERYERRTLAGVRRLCEILLEGRIPFRVRTREVDGRTHWIVEEFRA